MLESKMYLSGFIALLSLLTLHGADFVLIRNGKPAAEIVAAPKIAGHIQAFNNGLKRCAGAELPVVSKATPGKNTIRFEVQKRTIDKEDAYAVSFPDARTLVITCSPRSARWALNAILEKYAGVVHCFHTERGSHYPVRKDIAVPVKPFQDDADFKLARFFSLEDPLWMWDINGKQPASDALAVGHNIGVTVLPPAKYAYGAWHDKIMPVRNGKRIGVPSRDTHGWQPCYSHPEAVTEAIKNIDAYLTKHPDLQIFSISMNDLNAFCECPNCIKANGGLKKLSHNVHNWSDVYFKWCNAVVAGLEKKHPNVFFTTIAYCDVKNPPSFKLHPKIVVLYCTDFHAQMKQGRFEQDEKLLKAWSARASNLGVWEYGFHAYSYSIPRLPWRLYARGIRSLKQNKGNLFFCESRPTVGEGPKRYLYMKLAWNANADPEKLVSEWCKACVGNEAGKYLEQYYCWCHDFWTSDRVKQTPWYKTAGLYFAYSPSGTYVLALQKDDLAKCRALMEKMLDAAKKSGDADQKYRALKIYQFYEYHEALAMLAGGGFLPLKRKVRAAGDAIPDVNTKEEAVYLAGKIPEVADKLNRLPQLVKTVNGDKINQVSIVSSGMSDLLPDAFINPLFRWRNVPEVRAGLVRAAADKKVTEAVRRQIQSVLDFDRKASRTDTLSDSAELALWDQSRSGLKVEVDRSTGKRRIKVTRNSGWCAAVRRMANCLPGSSWAVEVTVSAPDDAYIRNANARIIVQSLVHFHRNVQSSASSEFYPLQKGKKLKMSLAVTFGATSYSQNLYVIWNGLQPGKHFYIDEIRFMELGPRVYPAGEKITSWWIPGKKTAVRASGGKVISKNVRTMIQALSAKKFKAGPGTRYLITIPVRGKGNFLPRLCVSDVRGKVLASLHGKWVAAVDSPSDYKVVRFAGTVPDMPRFKAAAFAQVCLDFRAGNLEIDNVELILLDRKVPSVK